MDSASLLSKVRLLHEAFQQQLCRESFEIGQAVSLLSKEMAASVLFYDCSSSLKGFSFNREHDCERLIRQTTASGVFPDCYREQAQPGSPALFFNREISKEACSLGDFYSSACLIKSLYHSRLAVTWAREGLGVLLLRRGRRSFHLNEQILAEMGAALIGIGIAAVSHNQQKERSHCQAVVSAALASLSYSETEAIEEIFRRLDRLENIIVASKIADALGITRSVIVNAIRKFESAGIIETRSLGMKGTFIRVKAPYFIKEISKCARGLQRKGGPALW